MLFAYFDRSELPQQGVVAVGGFLSTVSRWMRFEEKWQEVLSSEGVSCFHMADLEAWKGEFKDWPPKRRKTFLRRLIGVIGSIQPLAVSAGMLTSEYKSVSVSQAQRRRIGSHPYVWCAIDSVIAAMKWVKQHGRTVHQIACIFESGDEGSGEVLKALTDSKKRNTDFDQYLHSVTFAKKKDIVPLQAADFFAYETAKLLLLETGLDQREIRKSLKRLLNGRVSDVIGHYIDGKSLRWLAGEGEVSSSDAV